MKLFAKIVFIIVLLAVAVIFLSRLTEIGEIIFLLKRVEVYFIILVILAQGGTYISQAAVFKTLLRFYQKNVGLLKLSEVALAYTFINQFAPSGGLVGAPLFLEPLAEKKVTKGQGVLVAVMFYLLNYLSFFAILSLGFIGLFFHQRLNRDQLLPATIVFAIFFLLVGLFYVLASQKDVFLKFINFLFLKIIRRLPVLKKRSKEFHEKAKVLVLEFCEAFKTMTQKKKKLFWPFFYSFVFHLFDLLTIYLIFLNFNFHISLSVLVVGFCFANLVAMVSTVPMGVGVFEASMSLLYKSLGVPFDLALTVVLVYRAFSFWLMIPLGLFFYRRLSRRPKKES